MKQWRKFLSVWTVAAISSILIALDMYMGLKSNPDPSGDQLIFGWFIIVCCAAFAFVCIGAAIECYNDNK